MMKDNFVDVWSGEFVINPPNESSDLHLLSDAEREKAAHFKQQILQQKYIQIRGSLRRVLASYLHIPPQHIPINLGPYGKPYIKGAALYFNLSHTADDFIIAVSNCTEVGIDIELCVPRKRLAALARRCFSVIEIDYWNALPKYQQQIAFFRFWVRKEAFVKAVGRGLALELNRCSINPEQQNQFTSIPANYGLATDWQVIEIPAKGAVFGAIVTKAIHFKYRSQKLIFLNNNAPFENEI